MKKQLTFLLWVFVSCVGSLQAQQLFFNHISVNNGLSQGVNNCIYRDSKGFVWISSFDGLNRFDGSSCIIFRSSVDEQNGLKGTLFLNILEDQNSNLWIGSNAGLNFYNRRLDLFQNFRIEDNNRDQQFYSPFYIDNMGNVWLQSGSDIVLFNPESKTFKFFEHFFSPGNLIVKPSPENLFQPLKKIFAVNNNHTVLWEGEIVEKEISWHSTQLSIPASRITAILQTGNNKFWIGTNKGLYLIKNSRKLICINRFEDTEIKTISALHIDQNGTLWVGTLQQGLFSIDTLTWKVKNRYINSTYTSYALAGNQIKYIFSDDKGELWLSVWGKGVDFTSLNRFQFKHHVTKEEAVKADTDNFIRSIVQVNNEFWCSTQASGILILDENKKIKQSIYNGLPLTIEHIYLDKNNLIWAATFEGLFQIDPFTKKITKMPYNTSGYGDASNQYNYISSLQNGSILASTNAGIFIIEKLKNTYQFKQLKGISNAKDVFLTTYTDQLNHNYISRAFKGLDIYKLSGDSMILLKALPFEATIKCFNESTDSSLWIGTTMGLIKYNKYKLQLQQLITTKQGLSNHYVYGILSDSDHQLWISTNAGINLLDKRNNKIKVFSEGDGLQSNEYNTYSFCKTNKGEMLFGGVNGMNAFNPSDYKNSSYPPQLILTGLQVNDTILKTSINPSEINELSVDYNQNTIGFQFSVIHYANSASNTLCYTLEDYDNQWFVVASKTLIRYAKLPPGRYSLKVKALNADGIEADKIYSLTITVKSPWWQSLWFELLAIITFLGLMHFISTSYLRMRLEKQRAQNEKKQAVEKERNRISHDMHDDLGSGLTMIAILSEVVKKRLSEPEKAKELLEKIAVSSRDLVDSLQDIIWLLNPQNDTIESLSSYIREYGLKYFEPLSVQIDFNYPEKFSAIRLSEEQRRNTFLSVKESFNNIAKHADCKKVIVSIQESPKEIRLCIADDGKGFDMNSVRLFANGLKNMKERIEHVGGTYFIISEPEKGTLTEIKFQV